MLPDLRHGKLPHQQFTPKEIRPTGPSAVSLMEPNTQDILSRGIEQLQHNLKDGARVVATQALLVLSEIVHEIDPTGTTTGTEQWNRIRVCAYQLSRSRPSMSSTVTGALLAALEAMDKLPAEHRISSLVRCARSDRELAQRTIDDEIKSRQTHCHSQDLGVSMKPGATIRLLTLSNSSTVRRLLVNWAKTDHFNFEIRIIESRPACEGADLAAEIVAAGLGHGGRVVLGTDAHICELVRDCDILLLGADRILPDGSVLNKTGSLAAAIVARELSSARVVIYSETDKIAEEGAEFPSPEEHDTAEVIDAWSEQAQSVLARDSNGLQVLNIYFELVPAKYIDTYVTEHGLWSLSDIKRYASKKAVRFNKFFSDEIIASSQCN
jgi:translation initiation factor 2B subunit (eIF-2B alpha/beta/delta family)